MAQNLEFVKRCLGLRLFIGPPVLGSPISGSSPGGVERMWCHVKRWDSQNSKDTNISLVGEVGWDWLEAVVCGPLLRAYIRIFLSPTLPFFYYEGICLVLQQLCVTLGNNNRRSVNMNYLWISPAASGFMLQQSLPRLWFTTVYSASIYPSQLTGWWVGRRDWVSDSNLIAYLVG